MYLSENTIQAVKELDILQVLSTYLTLKKVGATYTCCSPFTTEKTASFHVNTAKQIFKCFSTGKGGDAIRFVMEHQNISFIEAIEKIANTHSIALEYSQETEQEAIQRTEKHLAKESLRITLSTCNDLFTSSILPKTPKTSKWSKATIEKWEIGYAVEGWDSLIVAAQKIGLTIEALKTAGLVTTSEKGKTFDTFRNRITFPYHDSNGKIVGFVARAVAKEDENYKYLYLKDTVWTKGNYLYGLHIAKEEIRNKAFAYLVEGQTDAIAMHAKGFANTVAIGSSNITAEQIKALKQFTDTVVIFPDNDIEKEKNAGIIALVKNASLLIKNGIYVKVLIPRCKANPTTKSIDPEEFLLQFNDGNKEELDTFFSRPQDFITDWYLNNQKEYATAGIKEKKKAVNTMQSLLDSITDKEVCQMYTEEVQKLWTDFKKIKARTEDKQQEKLAEIRSVQMDWVNGSDYYQNYVPQEIVWADVEQFYQTYNYFQYQNRVWTAKVDFRAKQRIFSHQSNFTFEVLFHLFDDDFPKRLVKFTNVQNKEMIVDVRTDEMATAPKFKQYCERLGNYLWTGKDAIEYVKEYQYQVEKSGHLKETLGHDANGFYALSNGAFHYASNTFIPANYTGVVEVDNKCYYLPSGNQVYANNEHKYATEKQFIYKTNNTIDFVAWAELYCTAYPKYGAIGLLFTISSNFSDIVYNTVGSFPLLFLFGNAGSGKGAFIKKLLALYGNERPNLKLSSKANTDKGMIRSLAQFYNASLLLDEYVPDQVINEFLKSIWDRDGYKKAVRDSRFGTETTPINTTVMVTSNQEPNDEPLFTRVIYLIIHAQSYTEQQRTAYRTLNEHEQIGLGDVLLDVLKHRNHFEKQFSHSFLICSDELRKELAGKVNVERMITNIAVLLASFDTLSDVLKFPFDRQNIKDLLIDISTLQQKKIDTGGELSKFFSVIQYLMQKGEVYDETHYKIDGNNLYLRISYVYELYVKEYIQRERKKPISCSVLIDTLKRSDVFMDTKKGTRFKNAGVQSCFLLHLDKTGIELRGESNNLEAKDTEFEEVFGSVI
jgi:DNA primase catalytic core